MTADYLSVKYPSISSPDDDSFIVSAHFFPTPGVVKGVEHLRKGQALMFHDEEIARRCPLDQQPYELIQLDEIPLRLTRSYDIFSSTPQRSNTTSHSLRPDVNPSRHHHPTPS